MAHFVSTTLIDHRVTFCYFSSLCIQTIKYAMTLTLTALLEYMYGISSLQIQSQSDLATRQHKMKAPKISNHSSSTHLTKNDFKMKSSRNNGLNGNPMNNISAKKAIFFSTSFVKMYFFPMRQFEGQSFSQHYLVDAFPNLIIERKATSDLEKCIKKC